MSDENGARAGAAVGILHAHTTDPKRAAVVNNFRRDIVRAGCAMSPPGDYMASIVALCTVIDGLLWQAAREAATGPQQDRLRVEGAALVSAILHELARRQPFPTTQGETTQ